MKTPKFLRRSRPSGGPQVFVDPGDYAQVLAIAEAIAPRTCPAWGSGGSTRALLETSPFIERYVSVEHDPPWYEQAKAASSDPRLSRKFVAAAVPLLRRKFTRAQVHAWGMGAETDAGVMADYVAMSRRLGLTFDFVLAGVRALVRAVFLEPWKPGQVCLIRKP